MAESVLLLPVLHAFSVAAGSNPVTNSFRIPFIAVAAIKQTGSTNVLLHNSNPVHMANDRFLVTDQTTLPSDKSCSGDVRSSK